MDDFSLHFLPKELRKTLKHFQKEGIRYGIGKNGRLVPCFDLMVVELHSG